MAFRIIENWIKWSRDWDALCNRCGKCCFVRSVEADGRVTIHYDSPCENLDTETRLCRVFEERFQKCDHCGKVGPFTVLFNPTLPSDCAYVQALRPWAKKE